MIGIFPVRFLAMYRSEMFWSCVVRSSVTLRLIDGLIIRSLAISCEGKGKGKGKGKGNRNGNGNRKLYSLYLILKLGKDGFLPD